MCVGLRWQEMNVFGHDDIAEDFEVVPESGALQGRLEESLCLFGGEIGSSAVTTEGDEVVVSFLLVSLEEVGHVVS